MIGNIVLEDDYGITWNMGPSGNGICTIGMEFSTGSSAQRVNNARTKYPNWVGFCSGSGPGGQRTGTPGAPIWTDSQILQCSSFVAAWNDAIWGNGGGIQQGGWSYGAAPVTRVNIIAPHGSFYINYPLILAFGNYSGQGSAQSAPDLNTPYAAIGYGTRLSIWHENWLDIPTHAIGNTATPVRHIMQSLNWPYSVSGYPNLLYAGVLGATGITGGAGYVLNSYYMEGTNVEGFRFDGRKEKAPEAEDGGNKYVTTYEDGGVCIFRPGSVSGIKNCVADNFNNAGFQVGSSVPGNYYNLRSFVCNYAAFWIRGDATCIINGFECDDCPTVFKIEAFKNPSMPGLTGDGVLNTPGCTLTVNNLKVETGITESFEMKGTMILDAEGWVVANFNGVNYAGAKDYPECLIRINPNPPALTGTVSKISVNGLKVFGYVRTMLHHAPTTGQPKKWLMDKGMYQTKYNSTLIGFEYNSADGGSLVVNGADRGIMMPVNYRNRQKWLDTLSERWDDTGLTGMPAYDNPAI